MSSFSFIFNTWIHFAVEEVISIAYSRGLQTTAREPNPVSKAFPIMTDMDHCAVLLLHFPANQLEGTLWAFISMPVIPEGRQAKKWMPRAFLLADQLKNRAAAQQNDLCWWRQGRLSPYTAVHGLEITGLCHKLVRPFARFFIFWLGRPQKDLAEDYDTFCSYVSQLCINLRSLLKHKARYQYTFDPAICNFFPSEFVGGFLHTWYFPVPHIVVISKNWSHD